MPAWTPRVVTGLTAPEDTAPTFRAVLRSEGINVIAEVPRTVSEWFGQDGHVPVLGLLGSTGFTATLVPVGVGGHKLYLNKEIRRGAAVAVGDIAEIRLWRDTSSRETLLPDDLVEALAEEDLLEEFDSWPPSHRREYVLAIEDAKRPETRARRIGLTIAETRSRSRRDDQPRR